jgi:hypothetical protein
MKLNKVIVIPALALTASLSLAACGSVKAPTAAPAATHTVTAPAAAPQPTTPAPTTPAPAKTVIVQPAPAKTVYVAPAAPAAPALTNCDGIGIVFAGPDTSCPFALNVEQAWVASGFDSYITASSPVTGLSYTMYCSGGHLMTCTGGNNALVEFYHGTS